MGSCVSSDPPLCSVRESFRKLRCVFACCGGKINIENSEIDGQTEAPIEREETENAE